MHPNKHCSVILGIILLSLTFCFATQAQDSIIVTQKVSASQIYSDIKGQAPKISQALTQLGKELKVGATAVWDILVRQQKVYSIAILLVLLLTIASWIHFWYRYTLLQKIEGHKNEDSSVFAVVVTLIIAVAGSITFGIYFTDMLTGFFNPEFGAMKTIAEIAQQIK